MRYKSNPNLSLAQSLSQSKGATYKHLWRQVSSLGLFGTVSTHDFGAAGNGIRPHTD